MLIAASMLVRLGSYAICSQLLLCTRLVAVKLYEITAQPRIAGVRFACLNNSVNPKMPVFIAFAAFMLLLFGQRLALSIGPWVVTTAPFAQKRKTRGQKSGVRTGWLEMVLDHDSGQMEGKCLNGHFAGRALSSLSCNELFELLQHLRANDAQGVLLLEAYLDRQFRGWREGGPNRHQKDQSHDERQQSRTWHERRHAMTVNEAYDVLGLKAGANQVEIRSAHRKLMMKFHPDQGGSTYLAARINQAKEILLSR